MKKVKRILTIAEGEVPFEKDSPIEVSLMNIHHGPVHIHRNALELVLCLEGEVSIKCNHEDIVLKENEIFSIDYEDLHCVYSEQDNMTLVMHIDYSRLNGLHTMYISCEDASARTYQKEMLQYVKGKVMAIAYRSLKKELSAEQAESASKDLMKVFIEHFDWLNSFETYQNKNEDIVNRMVTIFEYCNENYRNRISSSTLARSVNIDENYFSQFFRRSLYGGFNKMLGYIRCYNAQQYLLDSEMTITEIVSRVGFSDEKYFYKYFNYWFRKTPTQFRNWYKEYIKEPDRIEILTGKETMPSLERHMAEFLAASLT